jgi:general secretion pathway protein G
MLWSLHKHLRASLRRRPGDMSRTVARARRSRRDGGFTLIEVLVVLVILGLLAALAAPQAIGYLGRARTSAADLQVKNLGAVLDLYSMETGSYPSTEQGVTALISAPPGANAWNGPYVKDPDMIRDPWGRVFRYKYPGEHAEYDLYSLGADDQPGGDGQDRDVGNW